VLPIGLNSRTVNGSTLAAVQHPVVDSRGIGSPPDQPIENVYFTDKMPLTHTANRRIAGHGTELMAIIGDQSRVSTRAGSSSSSLAPSMTAANHNYVKVMHSAAIDHIIRKSIVPRETSLSDAKPPE
jgi:hypothetical protein